MFHSFDTGYCQQLWREPLTYKPINR